MSGPSSRALQMGRAMENGEGEPLKREGRRRQVSIDKDGPRNCRYGLAWPKIATGQIAERPFTSTLVHCQRGGGFEPLDRSSALARY